MNHADPSTVPSFIITKLMSETYKHQFLEMVRRTVGGYVRTQSLLKKEVFKKSIKVFKHFLSEISWTGNKFLKLIKLSEAQHPSFR